MKEDPSTALRNYSEKSTGIIDYIKNQLRALGSWIHIPGGVTKISASSSGYLWTIGQWENRKWGVYACKEPCTDGNWSYPFTYWSFPAGSKWYVHDITTDATNVYILMDNAEGNKFVAVAPANNPSQPFSEFRQIPLPGSLNSANKVAVTNGMIWVSDSSKKAAYCRKPCSTPNWTVRDETRKLQGGGGTSLYATAPGSVGLLKSDEILQTEWTPVKGLDGISISAVAAEANNDVLYASDSSKVYRCTDSCDTKNKLQVVNTDGRVTIQDKGGLTVNPANRNVWMASTSSGPSGGNIFYRLDAPDPSAVVLDHVDEVQNERDRIFNSLGGDVRIQTAEVSAKLAKADASDTLQKALDISGDKSKAQKEIQLLERKIESANTQVAGFEEKRKPLIILLISLAVVAIMYITVGWFMPYWMSMSIAVLVLGTGLGLSIYFSTNK